MVLTVVSERYRFGCLLIAKNASSTLRLELGDQRFESQERRYDALSARLRGELFVFGFVRHPVPRFLSAYQEISMRIEGARQPPTAQRWEALPEGLDRLSAFLEEAERSLGDPHLRRQVDALRGVRYDFLGRVETLQDDLARVYQRLGLGPLGSLPRRRSRAGRAADWGYSRHWHLEEDLPDEMVERIETLYRDDLELWRGTRAHEAEPQGDRPPPAPVRRSEPSRGAWQRPRIERGGDGSSRPGSGETG